MRSFYKEPVSLVLALLSLPALGAERKANGIPNFHRVNDNVFRGGQPADDAWPGLAELGVRVVIDLRRENEDNNHSTQAEARAVQAAGMRYVHVPMKGAPAAPTDQQISRILRLLDSNEPAFVHCKLGKDRTGTVIACYRIAHDRWENRKALDEAKKHGIHWYEIGMKAYVANFNPTSDLAEAASELEPAAAARP